MKIKYSHLLCITLAMMMLTSCGSSSNGSYSSKKADAGGAYYADASENAMEDAYTDEYEADSSNDTSQEQTSAKLIYTGTVKLETLEYDNAVQSLKKDIGTYGGFIENSSEQSNNSGWYRDDYVSNNDRSLTATVRIPSENFEAFIAGLSNYGQKTYESTNVENVSRQYADNEATIAALEKEEERLLEMMDRAVTIDEMIMVEERLTTVQGQLNGVRTRQSVLDTDIRYSTVTVNIDEVHKYTEIKPEQPTFGQRLTQQIADSGEGFLEFCEGLLFLFIALFPYLVIIGIIVFIVLRVRRKRKQKKAEKLAAQQAQPVPSTQNAPAQEQSAAQQQDQAQSGQTAPGQAQSGQTTPGQAQNDRRQLPRYDAQPKDENAVPDDKQ